MPLSRFNDGANGLSTAQMQNESFLIERGWTFGAPGWQIDNTGAIWNGYPFIHNYLSPPFRDDVNVLPLSGHLDVGLENIDVTFNNVVNIVPTDRMAVQIRNPNGTLAFQVENILTGSTSGENIVTSLPSNLLRDLHAGTYIIRAFILRDNERFVPFSIDYILFDKIMKIERINPLNIQKPVGVSNNLINVEYSVNVDPRSSRGHDLTFSIGDYSERTTNQRLANVSATAVTGAIAMSLS